MPKPPNQWEPLHFAQPNGRTPMAKEHLESDGTRTHYRYRTKQRTTGLIAFANRLYDGLALTFEDGSMHLSFKRRDRAAVRDWRHFQAIKNEVAGPDREAIEIFPHEFNLVDGANEYHLFVLPPDKFSPLGFDGPAQLGEALDTLDWASYRQGFDNGGAPGGRQREWENAIPTGTPLRNFILRAATVLLEAGWRPEGVPQDAQL